MSEKTISILDGSTFLVVNLNDSIDSGFNEPEGLFYKDTRKEIFEEILSMRADLDQEKLAASRILVDAKSRTGINDLVGETEARGA